MELVNNVLKKYGIDCPGDWNDIPQMDRLGISSAVADLEKSLEEKDFKHFDYFTILGLNHMFYNSQVGDELFLVLENINDGEYNANIASAHNLSPTHVEFMQYVLCDKGICDYGTSPRGCFFTAPGQALFDLLVVYKTIYRQNS